MERSAHYAHGMEETTKEQFARGYNLAQKAIYVRGLIAMLVLGAVLTAVGVGVDLRSGVVGTLVLGIALVLIGALGLIFIKPFFARRDRMVATWMGVPQDRV